jgi:hypothetical protein
VTNKIDFSQFELRIKDNNLDVPAVMPCVEFTLFLDMTDSDGIMEFYHRSLDVLGGLITHYQAENMKARTEITGNAFTLLPTWIKRPNYYRNYYLAFFGCKRGVSAAEIVLHLWFRPKEVFNSEEEQNGRSMSRPFTTQLRVTMPVEHTLAEPTKLIAWISCLKLVKDFAFHSGHCGHALNFYGETSSSFIRGPMEDFVASACLRHPGFYCCDADLGLRELWRRNTDKSLLPLIDRVNWLTLINEKQIEYLGGRDALKKAFAGEPSIVMHDLKQGVMIQAGDAPQIGDVGHKDFIPVYQKVAKTLRPIRIDEYGSGFGYDETDEWLNALDKE